MSLEDLLRDIRQGRKSESAMKEEADREARMQEMHKLIPDSGSGVTTAETSRSSSPESEVVYNGMSKDELEPIAKKLTKEFFFILLKADLDKTVEEQSSYLSDEEKTKLENKRYEDLAELAALEYDIAQVYKVLNAKLEEEKAIFDVGKESAKDILKAKFEQVKKEYLEIFGTTEIKTELDNSVLEDGNLFTTIKNMESLINTYNDNLQEIIEIITVLENLPEELKEKYNVKDFNSRCGNKDDKSCNVAIVKFLTQYSNLKKQVIEDMRALKLKVFIDAELKKIEDVRKERAEMRERNKTRKRPPMGIKKPPVNTSTKRKPLLSNFSKLGHSLLGSKPPSEGGKTVKRRNRKTKRQQKRRKNKSKAKNKCKK